jgi:cytohesin
LFALLTSRRWKAGSNSRAGRLILCLLLALVGSLSAQGAEIHKAVFKGKLNRVVALLKDHPEQVESKDNLGRTPLQVAVIHNKPEIAELLLANGADVNARDLDQQTPLLEALAVYKHDKLVRLLLANGADVNLSDRWGMTPLIYAVKQGQIDDAKILIANDANINEFVAGNPPLYVAIFGHHMEMVELLLASGADPNRKAGNFTPLQCAKQISDFDPRIEALIREYGGHE